ncbi:hypothetical protein [Mesorhizobium sp. B2-3-10]|uniref:hypothetical protein n=1 Tax=Mesorhizobium sp. B2-3-10 TaxID=2589954 RepID=UPI00112A1616|nr:hypothetical protein [Mesorhizobium sp. B2-3-10]TPM02119.1 hypothetical protein FJ943_08500 [Mesorhizobium sp. B2-3-10]
MAARVRLPYSVEEVVAAINIMRDEGTLEAFVKEAGEGRISFAVPMPLYQLAFKYLTPKVEAVGDDRMVDMALRRSLPCCPER